MHRRAASPALSENDFDITKSLFKDDVEDEDEDFAIASSKDVGTLNAGEILDLRLESDGDDAFISAQQAAANRKASNIKGKSVKKGGGFQAMGISLLQQCSV
jgi:ATP-dependent RNA helicase DDX54/DBP10